MPKARINDELSFYYEDSGPPNDSSSYITVVIVHGTVFHGGSFRPLFPHARRQDLRLILLNLRDYPGSSPQTDDSLENYRSPDLSAQSAEVAERGREIAQFLAFVIKELEIPQLEKAGKQARGKAGGGLAVVSWSSGNITMLSMLAHGDSLPEGIRELLNSYLRSVVVYDPPAFTLGASASFVGPIPSLGMLYDATRDDSLSPSQKVKKFASWVSGYNAPMADLSGPRKLLQKLYAGLEVPVELITRQTIPRPKDGRHFSTFDAMTAAEADTVATLDILTWSRAGTRYVDPSVFQENLRRALFKPPVVSRGHAEERLWPAVKVTVVWCDMSVGSCVLAAAFIADKMDAIQADPDKPRVMRDIQIAKMERANHLVHWDEPGRFCDFMAGCV